MKLNRMAFAAGLFMIMAAGAAEAAWSGDNWEVREAGGAPYLWENNIPYFTRFPETSHEILDLAGPWKFRADETDRGVTERWFDPATDVASWRDHTVPGSWQTEFPELLEYLGAGWYRRTFTTPDSMAGRFNRLVLDGAGFHTRVWINGTEAGRHSGNYSRWSLDVSQYLQYGSENTIVVRVDNVLSYSDIPPRIWKGSRLGWWEYAGIQRLAQIESSPSATVCKLAVTAVPAGTGGRLDIAGLVYNAGDEASVMVSGQLTDLDGGMVLLLPAQLMQVPARGVSDFRLRAETSLARPWSPSTPQNRYRLSLAVSGPGDREEQTLEIGFRKFEVRGAQLYLNDKPYYIRGLNRHEDDPDTGLYQSDERMAADVALLRELRVNHMRGAHYPNDPRWLDRLDRDGFTFTEEVPLYQAGMGFTKYMETIVVGEREFDPLPAGVPDRSLSELIHQQGDEELIGNAVHQMIETIERDRNHPSLVMWSVGNENMTLSLFPSSRTMHQRVIDAVRRFDPDRPVTFAIITTPYGISPALEGVADLADVISVNEYYGWYYGKMEQAGPYFDRMHQKWPDKPILVSEFGADAVFGRRAADGAAPGKFTEQYQDELIAYTWREIRARPDFMVGGMPWVFADFRVGWFGDLHPTFHMNEKGVLTHDRRKKPAFDVLKLIYQNIEANGP